MYKNCTGKTKLIYLKTKSGGGGVRGGGRELTIQVYRQVNGILKME